MTIRRSLPVFTLACVASAQVTPEFADRSYFAYGTGIGSPGFRVSAVNGVTEILVPCGGASFGPGGRYWILHRYNQATDNYDQVFTSPIYPPNDLVVRTEVGDLDAASGPEFAFVTQGGKVEIWNQATRTLLRSFTIAIGDVKGLALGDVDGDGDLDLAFCSTSSVQVRSADGTLLWNVPAVGGNDLAIGQLDQDPGLEIALSSGAIVDCTTRAVQWTWVNGFGVDVACADIDGDGRDEVVFGENYGWAWAFDIDTELPKWSLPVFDIDCITLADVDGDTNPELIVGEGQWGDVKVYDTQTQALERTISNPEHGVTSLALGDVDGDGSFEIVFGAGWTTTGPDHWYVADVASQSIEWTSPQIAGGFAGPVRGDVDGDGQPELVCAAAALSGGGVHLLVFDAATLTLEHFSSQLTLGSYGNGAPTDITLADVDGDGDQEVFLVRNSVTAFAWTGIDFASVWQVVTAVGGPAFRKIEVADLDGNGSLEVVLGSTQFLHVFPYGTTTELWHSFYLGGEVRRLAIGNSNSTPEVELHALSNDGNLYVFDGPTRTPRAILQDGGVDRTAVGLVGGLPALMLGDGNGNMFLYIHDGTGYVSIGPLPVASSAIRGLGWIPALGMFHVTSNDAIAVHDGLFPAWRSASYGTGFGEEFLIDLSGGSITSAGAFGLSMFDI